MSYDMSDIIGACNEIWIKKIDEGILLQKETFNEYESIGFGRRVKAGNAEDYVA